MKMKHADGRKTLRRVGKGLLLKRRLREVESESVEKERIRSWGEWEGVRGEGGGGQERGMKGRLMSRG